MDTEASVATTDKSAVFILDPMPAEETIGQWLFRYSVIRSWRLGCPGFHWQEGIRTHVLFWQDLRLQDRRPWYSQLIDGVSFNPSVDDLVKTFPQLDIPMQATTQISVTLGMETIRYHVFRRAMEAFGKSSCFYQDELCFIAAETPTDLARWQSQEIPGEEVLIDQIQHGQQYPAKGENWRLTKQGLVQYSSVRPFWQFWK